MRFATKSTQRSIPDDQEPENSCLSYTRQLRVIKEPLAMGLTHPRHRVYWENCA
jgi:hypothetical protein